MKDCNNNFNEDDSSDLEDYPEGTEICPVCEKIQNPMASEGCEHFFGLICEGFLSTNSNKIRNRLEMAWNAFSSEHDNLPSQNEKMRSERRSFGCPDHLLDLNPDECNLAQFLIDRDLLISGDPISTDSMLVGSGGCYYTCDDTVLLKLARDLRKAARASSKVAMTLNYEGVWEKKRRLEKEERERKKEEALRQTVRREEFPYVFERVLPAVYGHHALQFTSLPLPANWSIHDIEVPFEGDPFVAPGVLKPEAIQAAILVLKEYASKWQRKICLVLSQARRLYVAPDREEVVEDLPPPGRMRFDHMP